MTAFRCCVLFSGSWLLTSSGCASGGSSHRDAGPNPGGTLVFVDDLGDDVMGSGTELDPYRRLEHAIAAAPDGATIQVRPGLYTALPTSYMDPTCGNCADEGYRDAVPALVGFAIVGKSLHVRGENRGETILSTQAGYGVFFEDAGSSSIENLTVTGGVRDPDGRATDGAIVVRRTSLSIRDVTVLGNDHVVGDPRSVIGIAGVVGREGADIALVGSRIENNSWDGLVLYRSDPNIADSVARAVAVNNAIGCSEACEPPRGRGIGLAATWDSSLTAINNVVYGLWRGIGVHSNSHVIASNNLLLDHVGIGISVADSGVLEASNNTVIHNGVAGVALFGDAVTGHFVNGLVSRNGWYGAEWIAKYSGIWIGGKPVFALSYDDVWGNEFNEVCRGGVSGADSCTALDIFTTDGNLSADPMLDTSYRLMAGSPCIDAGDPSIMDPDGSRSDVGFFGGPHAGRVTPP